MRGGGSQLPEGLGEGPWSYSDMAVPAVSECQALPGHGEPRAFLQPPRVFLGKNPSSRSLYACRDGSLVSAALRPRLPLSLCLCYCSRIHHSDLCFYLYLWYICVYIYVWRYTLYTYAYSVYAHICVVVNVYMCVYIACTYM